MATTTKLPTIRRKYAKVFDLNGGLHYGRPTNQIGDGDTPNCEEVTLRDSLISKTAGTSYFASTNTYPLDGTVMHFDQYYKTDGTSQLMCHTTTKVYYYNTSTHMFVSLVETGRNLVCRVEVGSGRKNLVSKVTVRKFTSKNMVSRVTVS